MGQGRESQGFRWHQSTVRGPFPNESRRKDEALKVLILRGTFFRFWAIFDQFRSISTLFLGRFSHFGHFLEFGIRYTRTQESTMYYSPSRTEIEAGRPSAPAVK
jgi:hypothetical protein